MFSDEPRYVGGRTRLIPLDLVDTVPGQAWVTNIESKTTRVGLSMR